MRIVFCAMIITSLCVLSTSCMVGPDFNPKPFCVHQTYTEYPQASHTTTSLKRQYFVNGKDIPAEWWKIYHSPKLDCLIKKGITHSPNLAAAEAALVNAKETLVAQIGGTLYPQITGGFTANRQRLVGSTFGNDLQTTTFNLFYPVFNIDYTLDFFGGLRRQIENLGAQVDYQQYQVDATYLTLTSSIVTTAFNIASLRGQIETTHQLIHSQADLLTLVQQQMKLGSAALTDVLAQETQLAKLKATLPPLSQALSQNYHALSVLIGELPSADQLPRFDMKQLSLPKYLPISVPSSLLCHRPDILSSYALLHAANAQVGVAIANLYPQITISASYGWQANLLKNIFAAKDNSWIYGGGLTQPIFNAGSLQAKKRAAIAAYKQALAQYEQTILTAFQNVADVLRAIENDGNAYDAQVAAEAATRNTLHLTTEQYRLGSANYLAVLNAEVQYQQIVLNRIKAETSRYNDTAALFQALGGGLWNNPKRCPRT